MSSETAFLKKRLLECEEELARAQELLLIDPVTGFLNERGFLRALSAEMARCLREGSFLALCLVEIQNLEPLQNIHGLYGVQKVLAFVAENIKRQQRAYDLLGTTGRGLFWITAAVKKSSEGAAVAQRLYRFLNQLSYQDQELSFPIKAAVVTRVVCGGHQPSELLNEALKLLPQARLSPEPLILLGGESPEKKSLERELFNAITRGELVLALQPVINTESGQTVFYEVLARYISEDERTLSAGAFMLSVEDLGLFEELDRQILYKALVLLRESPELGKLAINLSQEYVYQNLARDLSAWVKDLKVFPEDLILEINERKSGFSPLVLAQKLSLLKAEGYLLSLDDFGVETSNLFLLRDIPWDFVKVDGRFVRGLLTNEFDRLVLGFLSRCARQRDFRLVAEQVEEERVLREVRKFGVPYAQGFYCGEPQLIPETRYLKPPELKA
ncbi:GGDEF domain-containing protein [Thermosulfurimonas marina]|uniref:GGDEF domain-containing protein n=1 Tax=Thermosulfurimonas marina TaxID=2047767 RepID=A0A6H1WSU8_9BACT|nr:bifunctional diguanylate cyclase/phosphodiesterase [Thermosulfurimonas marina]QJA06229.1 GGDEF domain-containing protein [Thermosulfurimonas marina]